ncbi:MAG TPA: trypsin-like peptidase domain-containing protein [Dehalococcoidales bacterium]|nr:trypsin-like peptidase domain-containing protein [Dehalococcoidales bacterium]
MKTKIAVVGVVLILMLFSMTGCVYFTLNPTPTTVPTAIPTPIDANWEPPAVLSSTGIATYPDFIPLVELVRPSVVAIDVTIASFDVLSGAVPGEGSGSGWIIDESGLIVTNNHIVSGASSITITLDDERSFQAVIVRSDPMSDLAVLKIDATGLRAAKIGDSTQLKVGQWVMAMGNSLGKGISATSGIVSNLDVTVQVGIGTALYNLIQTTAPINPGNSGGPLFNLAGEVVGVTSVKVATTGVEGTGFAISMDQVLPIVTELIQKGFYSRPWIGVSLYTVDRIVILRYQLSVDKGVLVTRVAAGSPADKIGIKAGDVITAIDKKPVADVIELNKILHTYQIGQSVLITYFRGVAPNTVMITLAASPPVQR